MTHPLDPLTAEEITTAVASLRRDHGADDGWRYGTITLLEPPKATLAAWDERAPLAREALVSLWNRADGAAYEAVVDIGAEQVTRFEHRPGVQPNFTTDEYHEVDEMLRAHPDVIAALAARGIDDPSLVLFDTWAYGEALVPKRYRGRRVGWTRRVAAHRSRHQPLRPPGLGISLRGRHELAGAARDRRLRPGAAAAR